MPEDEESDEVRALIEMSRSADYEVRADAARRLAHFAVNAAAADRLQHLILDPNDTMVTLVATAPLIAPGTQPAWPSWRQHWQPRMTTSSTGSTPVSETA